MPLNFLFFAVIAGIVIAIAVIAHKRNQERIASLVGLARSCQWAFYPADPYGLPRRWGGTPFDEGYDRAATNVLIGEVRGHPMVAFDYEYKTDTRDSDGDRRTTTHCFSVVALGMPCALPELQVGPEGLFARLGTALGMQDIELESEDFNRRYRVRCPVPKLATDVLTPRTMEALLASERIQFRFAGTDAVSWEDGKLEPAAVMYRSEVLARVVEGVPAFVWRDYGLGEQAQPAGPRPSPESLT